MQGQYFSGNDHRVYLLGNPLIWWGNLALLGAFLLAVAADAVRGARAGLVVGDERRARSLEAGLWLLAGWALHYVPFWAMGRVLYFHHYFPALLFSNMLSAIVVDYAVTSVAACLPERAGAAFFHVALGAILAGLYYR